MRFAVPLFASLAIVSSTSAALVARQSLPSCAVPCLSNADTGSCSPSDDSCLCKDQAFINSATTCIESSCSGSDLQNAEEFAQQLCLAVGVTLTVTSATATSAASPSSTSSSSPESTPSSSSSSGASMTSRVNVAAGAVAALVMAGAIAL